MHTDLEQGLIRLAARLEENIKIQNEAQQKLMPLINMISGLSILVTGIMEKTIENFSADDVNFIAETIAKSIKKDMIRMKNHEIDIDLIKPFMEGIQDKHDGDTIIVKGPHIPKILTRLGITEQTPIGSTDDETDIYTLIVDPKTWLIENS